MQNNNQFCPDCGMADQHTASCVRVAEPVEISELKEQFTDIEMLTKLFTAFTLLGEVLQHDSSFTGELLPACTEKFLQQANYKLTAMQYRMNYQSEQSFDEGAHK